jgi:7-cyano-7-deazaguanine synthase
MKKQAVLSLSGGLDSSTLLLHLLANGYEVCALSFDYGQKHSIELERAQELVKYLNAEQDYQLSYIEPKFNKIKYQIIKLDGLSQLLNSALVTGGAEVPEGHYAEENQRATVVPNRNKIFSSIIQSVALSIANSKNTECIIALGVHSGDHSVYPDCTDDFRQADEKAFKVGNWDSHLVNYYVPYMEGDKFSILQDGEKCCEVLGIDFDEVYKRTNTSYKPIQHIVYDDSDSPSTEWFSDFKSASSIERVEAFIKLGRKDTVQYADEYGPVSWEHVVKYVKQVIEEYYNSKK